MLHALHRNRYFKLKREEVRVYSVSNSPQYTWSKGRSQELEMGGAKLLGEGSGDR